MHSPAFDSLVAIGIHPHTASTPSSTFPRRLIRSAIPLTVVWMIFNVSDVAAHGFAGQRFFPATLTTDDPFVADELSLPTVALIPNPAASGSPATLETDLSIDMSKRITPNFAIGLGETWQNTKTEGAGNSSISGFANLDVNAKYLLVSNGPHELLLSVGVDAEIGASGSSSIGVDRFSTVVPQVFFGKGLGDLPKSLSLLRPFAVTGVLGVGFPTEAKTVSDSGDVQQNPDVLRTGMAIEYSLPYLQASVLDIGLRAPFNRLIPLVEFSFQTPLDRGQQGLTTGTINPGIIWAGTYFQIGFEALIPANSRTGHNVGAIAQLHFYIDDIFPRNILGKPLFGGR